MTEPTAANLPTNQRKDMWGQMEVTLPIRRNAVRLHSEMSELYMKQAKNE